LKIELTVSKDNFGKSGIQRKVQYENFNKDQQFSNSQNEILNPLEVKNSGRPLPVKRIPIYFEI